MEASAVATPEAPPEPVPSHDGQAEATRSTAELFEWSGFVHVGVGAQECEHGADGACQDHTHFHAWVCLPNSFQIRDITDKARAARARKARALRDVESDSGATLDMELDDLRRDHYDELLTAMARRSVEMNLMAVIAELQEDERFENHAQDAEEFARLGGLPEEERDAEEFERLQADMLAYGDLLQARIDTDVEKERQSLSNRPADEIIELERKSRIDNIADETYLHTYYTWVMYSCARKPTLDGFPVERAWADPNALRVAPPEVLAAVREKIRLLENRTRDRGDAAGN